MKDCLLFLSPINQTGPLLHSLPTGTLLLWLTARQTASVGLPHGGPMNGECKTSLLCENSLPQLFMLRKAFTCTSLNTLVIAFSAQPWSKNKMWVLFLKPFRWLQRQLILFLLISKLVNVRFHVVVLVTLVVLVYLFFGHTCIHYFVSSNEFTIIYSCTSLGKCSIINDMLMGTAVFSQYKFWYPTWKAEPHPLLSLNTHWTSMARVVAGNPGREMRMSHGIPELRQRGGCWGNNG